MDTLPKPAKKLRYCLLCPQDEKVLCTPRNFMRHLRKKHQERLNELTKETNNSRPKRPVVNVDFEETEVEVSVEDRQLYKKSGGTEPISVGDHEAQQSSEHSTEVGYSKVKKRFGKWVRKAQKRVLVLSARICECDSHFHRQKQILEELLQKTTSIEAWAHSQGQTIQGQKEVIGQQKVVEVEQPGDNLQLTTLEALEIVCSQHKPAKSSTQQLHRAQHVDEENGDWKSWVNLAECSTAAVPKFKSSDFYLLGETTLTTMDTFFKIFLEKEELDKKMARKLRPDSRKKVLNKARRTILKHLGIWLNRCCNELPDAKWFDATFSHGDLQVSVKHYRGKACKAKTKQEFMMLWYLKNAPSVVSPIASFNCGEDYMNILVVENLAGMVLLSDLLEGGNLPSKEALMLLRNLCRAVAEIHELKVVHTSLNPTTVFVDPQSQRLVLVGFEYAQYHSTAFLPTLKSVYSHKLISEAVDAQEEVEARFELDMYSLAGCCRELLLKCYDSTSSMGHRGKEQVAGRMQKHGILGEVAVLIDQVSKCEVSASHAALALHAFILKAGTQ